MNSKSRSQKLRAAMILRHAKGFTLIELMITVVISSVVIAAVYQIFATTSEAMYEVDTLSEMTERARFATELIARDVRSAGAFASPDTKNDVWRSGNHIALNGQYFVRGLILRPGAQDVVLPQQQQNNARWGQQLVSGDELIIVGALDFPFTFEVSRLGQAFPNPVTRVTAPANNRGAYRFFGRDPFDTSTIIAANTALTPQLQNALFGDANNNGPLMGKRGLRVIDRNGYMQFAPLDASSTFDATTGLTFNIDTAGVSGFLGAYGGLAYRQGGQIDGLEPSSEQDIGYEASLIDAYRYRLCVDGERDSRNIRLVRERLNFGVVMNDPMPANVSPALCSTDDPILGVRPAVDQVTILDNVVDFQVWADCAAADGNIADVFWEQQWLVPDGSAAPNDCLTSSGVERPFLARMLHIRVSVRTQNERRDLENYAFIAADVNLGTGTTTNPAQAASSLQTYDINDDPNNATRVKTFQLDIDLANFTGRTTAAPAMN